MAHQQRMSLEVEMSNYRKEEIAQQGVVANLHKQRMQLAADAENAAAELAAAQADCQAKDTIIAGLHAQVSCWPWLLCSCLKFGLPVGHGLAGSRLPDLKLFRKPFFSLVGRHG